MSELAHVLRHLLPVDDPNVLVGHATGDDAAVYRLSADRALVVTADFFTPIVDDPFDFGRIAAANALSDIYAMGGRPLFALNLVGFPRKLLPEGLLEEILRGGAQVAREAGIAILGGHSIDDAEPKYGMVAVGEVDPGRMVTNAAGRAGDVLVLTKALGSGVIATAVKAGAAPESVVRAAVDSMAALNRGAAEAAVTAGVHAGTDITGFGLLGHLRSLVRASGLSARIRASDVPLLEGARDLVAQGHVPGGTRRNLADLAEDVSFAPSVHAELRTLVTDAQTSGGLLLAVSPDALDGLLAALEDSAPVAAVVGTLEAGEAGRVFVD